MEENEELYNQKSTQEDKKKNIENKHWRDKCRKWFIGVGIIIIIIVFGIIIAQDVYRYEENAKNCAEKFGTSVGAETGELVGKAVGSWQGMTKGRVEGQAAGKEKGLSAEDTQADMAVELKEVGKLEVLVASVSLMDLHSVSEDYMALYLLKGDAVVTVDLNAAIIETKEDTVYITLPQPEIEPRIDQSKMQKEAEYQKSKFKGSAEDGMEAYINSMNRMVIEVKETLVNYDALLEEARQLAEKQVRQIVESSMINGKSIAIGFEQ